VLATVALVLACPGTVSPTTAAAADSQRAQLLVDGKPTLAVWLATTPDARRRGVTAHPLQPGEGMWFGWPEETTGAFWMKGVSYPLVLAWVAGDRRVIGLRRMRPCPGSAGSCPFYESPRPFRFAIELRPDDLRRSGLRVGSRVALGPLRPHQR
jgi:uncharacterized membrane protein (UPF0127 family)